MPQNNTAVKPSTFTLNGLQRFQNRIEEAELDGVTITLVYESPNNMTHDWTLKEVGSNEELLDTLEEADNVMKRRIMLGYLLSRVDDEDKNKDLDVLIEENPDRVEHFNSKVWNEISEQYDMDTPEEYDKVTAMFDLRDDVKEAIEDTKELYSRVDRSRSISIGQRLDQNSDDIGEYTQNVERVQQNLDFEQQASFEDADDLQEQKSDLTTQRTIRTQAVRETKDDIEQLEQQKQQVEQRVEEMRERAQELREQGREDEAVSVQNRANQIQGDEIPELNTLIAQEERRLQENREQLEQIREQEEQIEQQLEQAESKTVEGAVWYNRDGQEVHTDVQEDKVVYRFAGKQRTFKDKQRAERFYEENRLG